MRASLAQSLCRSPSRSRQTAMDRIVCSGHRLADNGWDVRPHVYTFWSEQGMMGRVGSAERIAFTPSARKLYCRPDGSPKRVGDKVLNRDYGGVLRAIAKAGPDAFYRGEIADAI